MHTSQFINYFFERIWNNTFVYFTYWTLLIQAFYYIGVLKKFQESVLLITITVSILGAILTYVYPQKLVTPHLKLVVSDSKMQITDLLLHQIPLIILLCVYDPKIKPDNLLFGGLVFLIYVLIYNPINVYSFKCDKSLAINSNNKNNKFINDNKFRYHVAATLMILYFVILILAVSLGMFK
jgi:hypothetical protein